MYYKVKAWWNIGVYISLSNLSELQFQIYQSCFSFEIATSSGPRGSGSGSKKERNVKKKYEKGKIILPNCRQQVLATCDGGLFCHIKISYAGSYVAKN